MEPQKKRFAFMDALNVLAIMAVVLMHVSMSALQGPHDTTWHLEVVFQCAGLFAVPIFFMVSGTNLLGYRSRYSTADFFKKRALRVVVTLVVWSAIFYLLLCFCSDWFGYAPRRFGLVEFVKELLTGTVTQVYWFFYAIIGLYLVTPIFSLIVGNKNVLRYTIILAALMGIVVPTIEEFFPIHWLVEPYRLDFFPWAIFFYLLGYYLTHYVGKKISPAILGVLVVGGMVSMTGLTLWINGGAAGEPPYNVVFAKAESVINLFYAPALFLLFKQAEERIAAAKWYPTCKVLSALSLKVYAMHLIFVWIFEQNVLTCFATNSPEALLLKFVVQPVLIYGLSLAIAWLIEKGKAILRAKDARK